MTGAKIFKRILLVKKLVNKFKKQMRSEAIPNQKSYKRIFTAYYPDQFNTVTAEIIQGYRNHISHISIQDVKQALAVKLGIPINAFELSQNGRDLPLNVAATTYFQEESLNMNFAGFRPKVIIRLTNPVYVLPHQVGIVHPILI